MRFFAFLDRIGIRPAAPEPEFVEEVHAVRSKVTDGLTPIDTPVAPFGKRPTPPPAPFRSPPIEDMTTVMVPKRDSDLIADILRVRMQCGTPQVIDGSEMSSAARAIRYTLATDSANGSSVALDWLRQWAEGDPEAKKEMEAYENDGD